MLLRNTCVYGNKLTSQHSECSCYFWLDNKNRKVFGHFNKDLPKNQIVIISTKRLARVGALFFVHTSCNCYWILQENFVLHFDLFPGIIGSFISLAIHLKCHELVKRSNILITVRAPLSQCTCQAAVYWSRHLSIKELPWKRYGEIDKLIALWRIFLLRNSRRLTQNNARRMMCSQSMRPPDHRQRNNLFSKPDFFAMVIIKRHLFW